MFRTVPLSILCVSHCTHSNGICHTGLFALKTKTKLNSVALVRERTIPTERPPPVGEVSANFCG